MTVEGAGHRVGGKKEGERMVDWEGGVLCPLSAISHNRRLFSPLSSGLLPLQSEQPALNQLPAGYNVEFIFKASLLVTSCLRKSLQNLNLHIVILSKFIEDPHI